MMSGQSWLKRSNAPKTQAGKGKEGVTLALSCILEGRMLPRRIVRENPSVRICEYCEEPLETRDGEPCRDFLRRKFCGKSCAIASRKPYRTRHEMLMQNCEPSDHRGCWNWTEYKDKKGYGRAWDKSGEVLAHRLSYMEFIGPIPEGLHILHSCDNSSCINPAHLRAGTNDDNVADRHERNRWHKPSGIINPRAKLTEMEVCQIRDEQGKCGDIAKRYGVSSALIGQIKSGKIWRHVK